MIVALSRFTYSKEKQKYRKIIDKVEIGDYLILDNVSTKNRNVKYKLNSFINHMGSSLESGHYQAYVRHPKEERWLNFDDAYVTEQDCQKSETLFNSFK
jgi:ubiquitin C-terminal hydrolase